MNQIVPTGETGALTAANLVRNNLSHEANNENAETGHAVPTGGVTDPPKVSTVDANIFANAAAGVTDVDGVAGVPPQTAIENNAADTGMNLGSNFTDEG